MWDHELPAGEIAEHFDVTFGAVSQHLAVLRGAGFVRVRRDGNRRLYQTDRQALGPLRSVITSTWAESLDRLAAAVESEVESEEGNDER